MYYAKHEKYAISTTLPYDHRFKHKSLRVS